MLNQMESNRLIIRSTKKEDTEFSLDIWLDDEMGKYLSDPPRALVGDLYNEWKETIETYDGCYYFVAISKESSQYIGTCSLVPNQDLTVWDLGYTVHKDHWNQGFATEIIKTLIEVCAKMGGKKVTASVAKENRGSNAVLKKLGFNVEKEGVFRKQKTDIYYEEFIYSFILT